MAANLTPKSTDSSTSKTETLTPSATPITASKPTTEVNIETLKNIRWATAQAWENYLGTVKSLEAEKPLDPLLKDALQKAIEAAKKAEADAHASFLAARKTYEDALAVATPSIPIEVKKNKYRYNIIQKGGTQLALAQAANDSAKNAQVELTNVANVNAKLGTPENIPAVTEAAKKVDTLIGATTAAVAATTTAPVAATTTSPAALANVNQLTPKEISDAKIKSLENFKKEADLALKAANDVSATINTAQTEALANTAQPPSQPLKDALTLAVNAAKVAAADAKVAYDAVEKAHKDAIAPSGTVNKYRYNLIKKGGASTAQTVAPAQTAAISSADAKLKINNAVVIAKNEKVQIPTLNLASTQANTAFLAANTSNQASFASGIVDSTTYPTKSPVSLNVGGKFPKFENLINRLTDDLYGVNKTAPSIFLSGTKLLSLDEIRTQIALILQTILDHMKRNPEVQKDVDFIESQSQNLLNIDKELDSNVLLNVKYKTLKDALIELQTYAMFDLIRKYMPTATENIQPLIDLVVRKLKGITTVVRQEPNIGVVGTISDPLVLNTDAIPPSGSFTPSTTTAAMGASSGTSSATVSSSVVGPSPFAKQIDIFAIPSAADLTATQNFSDQVEAAELATAQANANNPVITNINNQINTTNTTLDNLLKAAPASSPVASATVANVLTQVKPETEVIKNILAKKYYSNNKMLQVGGDDLGEMQTVFQNLHTLYNIYNSNIILQLVTTFIEPTIYNALLEQMLITDPVKKIKFTDMFFINVQHYTNVKAKIEAYLGTKAPVIKIADKIKRDTKIYTQLINTINKVSNIDTKLGDGKGEYLFAYTFINDIINAFITAKLGLDDFKFVAQYVHIVKVLFLKISLLLYSYQSYLNTWVNTIKNSYYEIINIKRKVFSFVKIRADLPKGSSIPVGNPRYKYEIKDNDTNSSGFLNQYLLMNYKNFDGVYDATKESVVPETYYFGPYNGIYSSTATNQEIALNIFNGIDQKFLKDKEDVCFIGYGQSGSGKTSTLIFLGGDKSSGRPDQNGIVVEVCNKIEMHTTFKQINLKMRNIYLYNGKNKTTGLVNDDYLVTKEDRIIFTSNKSDPSAPIWKTQTKLNIGGIDIEGLEIGKTINTLFDTREIAPTINNPDSSRSHVVICLEFILETPDKDGRKSRNIIICDLAGVENTFICEGSMAEIIRLANQYTASGKNKQISLDDQLCKQLATIDKVRTNLDDKYIKDRLTTRDNLDVKTANPNKYAFNSIIQDFSTLNMTGGGTLDTLSNTIYTSLTTRQSEEDNLAKLAKRTTPPPTDTEITSQTKKITDADTKFKNDEVAYFTELSKLQNKINKQTSIKNKAEYTLKYNADPNNTVKLTQALTDAVKALKTEKDPYDAEIARLKIVMDTSKTDADAAINEVYAKIEALDLLRGGGYKYKQIGGTPPTELEKKINAAKAAGKKAKKPQIEINVDVAQIEFDAHNALKLPGGPERRTHVAKGDSLKTALENAKKIVADAAAAAGAAAASAQGAATAKNNARDELEKAIVIRDNKIEAAKIKKNHYNRAVAVPGGSDFVNDKTNYECSDISKFAYQNQGPNEAVCKSPQIWSKDKLIYVTADSTSILNIEPAKDDKDTKRKDYFKSFEAGTSIQYQMYPKNLFNVSDNTDKYLDDLYKLKKIYDDIIKKFRLKEINKDLSNISMVVNMFPDLDATNFWSTLESTLKISTPANYKILYTIINNILDYLISSQLFTNTSFTLYKDKFITQSFLPVNANDRTGDAQTINNFIALIQTLRTENNLPQTGIISKLQKQKFMEALVEKIKTYYKGEIKKIECEIMTIRVLVHNCKLRRDEGYMINDSLEDLAKDVTKIVKRSISTGTGTDQVLPIFFDKDVFPYCRNIDRDNSTIYSEYYKNDTTSLTTSGQIYEKVIKEFNTIKLNFFIFTVINLTDKGAINNPPTPPYINLNKLYLAYRNFTLEQKKSDEISALLIAEYKGFITNLKEYKFYRDDPTVAQIFSSDLNQVNKANVENLAKTIIKIVRKNNAATLIGTLESTDKIHSITYDNLTCGYDMTKTLLIKAMDDKNAKVNISLDVAPFFENEKTKNTFTKIEDVNNTIKNKYLKYKFKYLKLKEQHFN
jgi:hypothetical protein